MFQLISLCLVGKLDQVLDEIYILLVRIFSVRSARNFL